MSEVFGDDFPDCRPTPADRVKAAVAALLAVQELGVERAHAEVTLAVEVDALAREVTRLNAHLQTCEAARTNAEVRLAELEAAVTRVAAGVQCLPADATGDAMLCDAEHAASDTPPVCAACHHVRVQQLQARVAELEAEARGDRQARDQLVQAVRVAIREAVPGA